MKKFFILIIATVFVFASCSFTAPKTISVKTKADYELTVMKIDESSSVNKDLVNNFSTDSLFVTTDNSTKVYDYWPDQSDKTKQFLISVNVATIPFDLSSYLSDLDVGKNVSDMSFEKEIEIPEFKESTINEPVSMDSVTDELNSMVKFGGNWDSSRVSASLILDMESSQDFESIYYEYGRLYVFVKSNEWPYSMTLTHNGETIAEASYFSSYEWCDYKPETSLLEGEEPDFYCVLNIENKYVYKDGMEISIYGGNVSKYYGEMRKDEGKITKAIGVSTDGIKVSPANGIEVETALDDDSFADCVIKKGEMALSFDTPDSWIGVSTSWDNISISGGLEIPDSNFKKENDCIADLNDVAFKNENTIVNPTVSLRASNATFVFADVPSVKGHFNVEEIKSITVKLPEGTKTKVESPPTSLEDSMGDSVSRIVFGDSKVTGTYYNTLPEGNDFGLSCVSKLLGIDGSASLNANPSYTADNPQKIEISADNGNKGKTVDAPLPDLDFTSEFDFGAKEGFIRVNDVNSGEKYKIGVNVTLEFDWIEMTVKDLADTEQKNDDIDTGFELSSVIDNIKSLGGNNDTLFNALQFDEIPLYVYCQIPEFLEGDVRFEGNLILGKMKDDVFKPYVTSDSPSGGERLFDSANPTICSVPKLKFSTDSESMEFVSESIENKPYSGYKDLCEVLADGEGTLAFKCENIRFTSTSGNETVITKAEIDSMKAENDEAASYSVELTAYVKVPLKFKVGNEGDDIDEVYTLLLMGEDGSSAGNNSSYDDNSSSENDDNGFLNAVKEIGIAFDASNVPFICKAESPSSELQTLGICVDFSNKTEYSAKDYISLDGKYYPVLNEENVSELINSGGAEPKLVLGFPKGTLSISRNVKFLASMNLKISTDGTIPIVKPEGGR